MRNDYGSLVEPWKIDLIIDRAMRKGFRKDELEDVQQDVVMAILSFKYDPDNEAGASEETVLNSLVEKQLTFIMRTRGRRAKHEKKYRLLHGVDDKRPVPVFSCDGDQDREIDIPADVGKLIAGLTPLEQEICAALADGKARSKIVEELGISRYELDSIIERIAQLFTAEGLDAWVGS